ncbi:DUF1772 domain-containing protein [Streptomyces sp. NPDC059853]|uniref:anthrone oxygenase family protein n=1 Tax=Streptomyces sp. NPDC059853 TaxID=3346973 RepID=UPI00365DAF9E
MTFLMAALPTATLLTAACMTGVFFAFSVAVMPGLNAVDPGQSVAAMRSVNERILNPLFLGAFVGVPLLAAGGGALLLPRGERGAAVALFAAAGVYALGVFAPTALVNVPLNDLLAAAGTPDSAEHAARLWAGYAPRWTAWNTARAAAGALTVLLTALALYLWARGPAPGRAG